MADWRHSVDRLALVVFAAACGSHVGPATARLSLHPCMSAAARELARCGTIEVPENRALPTGRRLRLAVVVLPALVAAHKGEPILFVDGGPGLPATRDAGYVKYALDPVRGSHDLVMVDMRGTGDNASLACNLYDDDDKLAPYLEPMFPLDKIRACAARLAKRADLSQYTTEIAAQDLDDVRAALGAERWSLYGASYGTRLSLEYMRRFPEHVRRAALLGILPPEAPIGRDFARGGDAALDSAFVSCATDSECHAASPDPRGDVEKLLARLRAKPATLALWNRHHLVDEAVTMTEPFVREAIFVDTYQPANLTRLFPMIHSALANGDMKPLAEHFAQMSRARRTGRREGLMLSVYCAEDAPRLTTVDSAVDNTLLGTPTLHELLAACSVWPRGQASARFRERVVSSVPTLLMSGGKDPATPPSLADSAAAGLSNVQRYHDPGAGHAVLDERARARMAEFFLAP